VPLAAPLAVQIFRDLSDRCTNSQINGQRVPRSKKHVVLRCLDNVSVELHVVFCKAVEIAIRNRGTHRCYLIWEFGGVAFQHRRCRSSSNFFDRGPYLIGLFRLFEIWRTDDRGEAFRKRNHSKRFKFCKGFQDGFVVQFILKCNLTQLHRLGGAKAALDLGYLLYLAGRYDEAQAALQKALDLNPQLAFAHADLGRILIAEERPQQALAEVEKEPNDWEKLTDQALVYHALGREQDSNAALAELIAKHDTDWAYQIAVVYAFRGQLDKSFEWLERAYKQRDPGLPGLKTDPLLKNVGRDPRFTELLKKMRLPI
jgi:Tetratricopeptide repeat